MHTRFLTALVVSLLLTTPAMADWTFRQKDGFAMTRTSGSGLVLELSCRRGQPLELLLDFQNSTRDLGGTKSLMLWLQMPDGRTDRWPVDVVQEGPVLSGRLFVSDFNLDFFRSGKSFELTLGGSPDVLMRGNMKGTGAARLAFKEQCGI